MGTNIPEGYRQTDVGVIPEDWNCEDLKGKIAIMHGFGFQSQYFNSQGLYRLATPGHFYEEGGFRQVGEKQKYYDGPLPDGYLLQSGDLIVAMTEQAEGLLGSAAIIPDSGNYLHNQRLGKVKPISPDIELRFLYYIFNSKKFRWKVRETSAGTKVKHTSPNKLLEIAVPLPPLPEQKAIAQSLSDVDALIAALDQLITKKRNIKQGTMQQLLTGKKRLPGFSGEWEVKTIGEIGSVSSGGTPNRNNPLYWNGNIPWITTSQINFNIVTSSEEFITELGLNNSAAKMYEKDTLIMAMYGQGKTRGKVAILGIKATTNQACVSIRLNKNTSNKYVFFYLSHKYEEIRKLSNNGNQENLNGDIIKSIPILIPPPSEQKAIAQILSDMDAEIKALEQKRDKYKAIKQGMMQELLTGKIRLINQP